MILVLILSCLFISDIDECATGDNPCEECINTIGSYECRCRDGFYLDEDGVTCSRKYLSEERL